MSVDLHEQLEAYGAWLEQHSGVALRPPGAAAERERAEPQAADQTEAVFGAPGRKARPATLLRAVAAVVAVGMVGGGVWLSQRPTAVSTVDPAVEVSPVAGEPLFVLPGAMDGLVLSDGSITADPLAGTGVVLGQRDGAGFRTLIVVREDRAQPGDRPGQVDRQIGDRRVVAESRSADEAQVRQAVAAVRFDGDALVGDPDALAAIDLEQVGVLPDPLARDYVGFFAAEADGTAWEIFTVDADPLFLMGLAGGAVQPVRIGGKEGWISTRTGDDAMVAVAWRATPTRVVGVSADGAAADVIAFAEALRFVDRATWEAVLPDHTVGPAATDPSLVDPDGAGG